MPRIDINDDEARILIEVLRHDVEELVMEISNTDRLEYRDRLKSKRDALNTVIERISAGT